MQLPRGLAGVLVLAIACSGCATGDRGRATRKTATTPTTAGIPPAPAAPGGPLPADLLPILDELARHPVQLEPAAVARVGRSGDVRLAWLLVDLLRYQLTLEAAEPVVDALTRLTGYAAANDEDSVAWVAYADALLGWDTPAPPGYFACKRAIFLAYEEHWASFFDPKADLDWREVAWGGVGRDRIPALIDPERVGAVPGPGTPHYSPGWWLPDDDTVFGMEVAGEARAYPLRILEVHELVNDTLGGRRIGLAYCTLCGTAIGYLLDGMPPGIEPLELRTSGLLRRSNKLMYDARTESLFDQFRGLAVTGPLRERRVELARLPVVTTTWGEWRAAHPDTTILSRDAGTGREYGPDPLQGRDDAGPIFPIGRRDMRLPVQEPVLGALPVDGPPVAFPVAEAKAELRAGRPVTAGGVELRLEAGGLVTHAAPGGPELAGHQSFWFAWSQFRPDTLLWRAPR